MALSCSSLMTQKCFVICNAVEFHVHTISVIAKASCTLDKTFHFTNNSYINKPRPVKIISIYLSIEYGNMYCI